MMFGHHSVESHGEHCAAEDQGEHAPADRQRAQKSPPAGTAALPFTGPCMNCTMADPLTHEIAIVKAHYGTRYGMVADKVATLMTATNMALKWRRVRGPPRTSATLTVILPGPTALVGRFTQIRAGS